MTTIACDRYLGSDGARELVLIDGAYGSRLLVDRRCGDGGDPRLVAHLAADEPARNAELVCRAFLADRSRRARPLVAEDLRGAPEGCSGSSRPDSDTSAVLTDAAGRRYALRVAGSPPELRWQIESADAHPRRISAREVIGALEAYEPVCTIMRAAVARHRRDRDVSVAALALELRRIEASPIVLNRRLREAVIDAVRDHGKSLSAIAMACGRVKHDQRGNGSGETSWLARRVGLAPAGSEVRRNPWVHSDTLALIAREGLGLAPREVELP